MLTHHVALVPFDEAVPVEIDELTRVAAALQKQLARDFIRFWGISGTVDAFHDLARVPAGYWPILVTNDVPQGTGVHSDNTGAPYALVELGPRWSITASHECLEMLVDPSGNLLEDGDSPTGAQGRVQYLVEVCDPCQATAYSCDGVPVSDFCTPAFYAPSRSPALPFSFTGTLTHPHTVAPGGYLSWRRVEDGQWFQLHHFGDAPVIRKVPGPVLSRSGPCTLREAIAALTPRALTQLKRIQIEDQTLTGGRGDSVATALRQLVRRRWSHASKRKRRSKSQAQ